MGFNMHFESSCALLKGHSRVQSSQGRDRCVTGRFLHASGWPGAMVLGLTCLNCCSDPAPMPRTAAELPVAFPLSRSFSCLPPDPVSVRFSMDEFSFLKKQTVFFCQRMTKSIPCVKALENTYIFNSQVLAVAYSTVRTPRRGSVLRCTELCGLKLIKVGWSEPSKACRCFCLDVLICFKHCL